MARSLDHCCKPTSAAPCVLDVFRCVRKQQRNLHSAGQVKQAQQPLRITVFRNFTHLLFLAVRTLHVAHSVRHRPSFLTEALGWAHARVSNWQGVQKTSIMCSVQCSITHCRSDQPKAGVFQLSRDHGPRYECMAAALFHGAPSCHTPQANSVDRHNWIQLLYPKVGGSAVVGRSHSPWVTFDFLCDCLTIFAQHSLLAT